MLVLDHAAGPCKGLGDVYRALVSHNLAVLPALTVESCHGSAQEADCRGLRLVIETLLVGEPCGVVADHVASVVYDTSEVALQSASKYSSNFVNRVICFADVSQ